MPGSGAILAPISAAGEIGARASASRRSCARPRARVGGGGLRQAARHLQVRLTMSNAYLRSAYLATIAIVPLAAIATLGGLLMPGLYSERMLAPAMRGQDLLTLLTLPLLVTAMAGAQRGSARATLVWLGLLGYELYTYAGAAFAYRFNRFFLIYVALFALSALALGAGWSGTDTDAFHRRLDDTTPRRSTAAFLAALALLLAISELGQIIPALAAGSVPALLARSDGAGNFVYVLDLGVVAPLAAVAAFGLVRRAPGADLLAGCLLIKAATMGLALLAMIWFSVRAGQPAERALTVAYAAMAVAGMAAGVRFLAHVPGSRGGRGAGTPQDTAFVKQVTQS
jgi:hypothetical protein